MKIAPLGSNPLAPAWLGRELAMLQTQLNSGGAMAGLQFLNGRVPHRFTAIYKFQGAMERAVFIYDKLGQPNERLNAIPLVDSFSQYITASTPFSVTDSATDGRLGEHKHRGVVSSFYGVSLLQADGMPTGSLCHYDFDAQAMPTPEECIFLNRAKSLMLTRLNGFQS
jgi:hypothetical protein